MTFNLGASFEWGSELFGINELTINLVGKDMAISFRLATQADEAGLLIIHGACISSRISPEHQPSPCICVSFS